MKQKQFIGIAASVVLAATFLEFVLGMINFLVFLIVAAVMAVVAYKILPRIN